MNLSWHRPAPNTPNLRPNCVLAAQHGGLVFQLLRGSRLSVDAARPTTMTLFSGELPTDQELGAVLDEIIVNCEETILECREVLE